MAGLTIGGFYIKTYESTRSWGIEPASASGVGVVEQGGSPSIGCGDYVAYSILGVMFYGIVASMERLRTIQEGDEWAFSIVDNRIRLRWAIVFGQWNMEEDPSSRNGGPLPQPTSALDGWTAPRSDFYSPVSFTPQEDFYVPQFPAPALSSAKPKRMFRHIHPVHWPAQMSTYTATPHSARKILDEAVRGAFGGGAIGLSFHSSQSKPVMEIDANSGMSLAALIQTVADAQGLQITMDGADTLRFDRRGGTVVIPEGSHVRRIGDSISSDPTKVRVVGGHRLVQVNNVELLPDWGVMYEEFINEHAWLAKVEEIMATSGPQQTGTPAYHAEVAAYARSITVGEFLAHYEAGGGEYTGFRDNGYWRGVKRLDLPVWTYVREIVFRAYSAEFSEVTGQLSGDLFGIPMSTIDLHEGLICGAVIDDSSDTEPIQYDTSAEALYPGGAAFVAVKGQPLDLLDSMVFDGMSAGNMEDLSDKWSAVNDFTIDPKRMTVYFSKPVFIDGYHNGGSYDEKAKLLKYPNRSEGIHSGEPIEGLEPDSPYADIVVPNPDYKIGPAEVFASFVFKLGIFFKDFGSGPRWTSYHAPGIGEHLLVKTETMPAGVGDYTDNPGFPDPPEDGFAEILYENGQTARQLASEASEGLIARSGLEQSGEFLRSGVAGMALTSAIDRITTRLNREEGLTETVEFSKPRPSRGFRSSKEMAERVKNEELYDGQRELKKEVEYLRAISRLNYQNPDRSPATGGRTYDSVSDVLGKPAGNAASDTRQVPNPNAVFPEGKTKWTAGDLVWVDESGHVSLSGVGFAGVCVMDSEDGFVTVERSGIAPVAVAPGTVPGPIAADPGDWKASAAGSRPIGMLAHAEAVPGSGESTLALVRLGGGGSGGSAPVIPPLTLVDTRPAYIPAPEGAVADGSRRYYVTWGFFNGRLASNWQDPIDVVISAGSRWVVAKVSLHPTAQEPVTGIEYETWSSEDQETSPDWAENGNRPAFMYIPIGQILVEDGVASHHSSGGGSMEIGNHVSHIEQSVTGGWTFRKTMHYTRYTY